MVRALQRSILGRNCGASFCSMIVQRTPRRPRSMASVKPVGPAPTMRTWVSMASLAAGSKSASSVPSCTTSPTAHFSAFRRPSAGARNVCSIFIASSTSSGAPRRKSTPGSASIRVTVPGIGATMRLAAAASPMSAANGSIQASSMCPRGVVSARSRPDQATETRSGASPRHRSSRPLSRGTNCSRALLPPNSMVSPSRPYQRSASYRCAP